MQWLCEYMKSCDVFKMFLESEEEIPPLLDIKKIERVFRECVIIVDDAHRLRNTNQQYKYKNSARAIELIARYASDTRIMIMM